jgi:hypothetical protein
MTSRAAVVSPVEAWSLGPIIPLAVSGEGLSKQQLNDISLNFLRTQLVTVPAHRFPIALSNFARQRAILECDRCTTVVDTPLHTKATVAELRRPCLFILCQTLQPRYKSDAQGC